MKKYSRTVVNPISAEEHKELQNFLMNHGLCIKGASKNIRVYRYFGTIRGKMHTSPDFMYVVGADAYRANKEKVFQEILANSKIVMDKTKMMSNASYEKNMSLVEEDLLINHSIHMMWQKSKTVAFRKIGHVVTDREVLAPLDKYVKNTGNMIVTRPLYKSKDGRHLQQFNRLVKIFEMFEDKVPYYDWHSFRIVERNGKVVAAYSNVDTKDIERIHFQKGILGKFDYNLNIMNKDYISGIVEKAKTL